VPALAAEYILFSLFYSYANPDVWVDKIPHRYILYITLLLVTAVAFVVVNREEKEKELVPNLKNFSGLKTDILVALGLSVFCTGTFILYHVIQAKLHNSPVISSFVDNNLYVLSASNWVNVINHILYPLFVTFVFQGFLLNGLTKQIGFRNSNVATSLFYGFWFGDIFGGTVFNLFQNLMYWKTKNIFYPGLMSVATSLVFILAYLIREEMWFLKADSPAYNGEIIKGVLIAVAMAPIAVKVVRQALKNEAE
jgi:hypothetical protein